MGTLSEIGQKIGWTLLEQSAAGSGLLTIILLMLARYAFDKLPRRSQRWIFGVGSFVGITLLFVLFANALRPSPHLSATIDRIHVTARPLNEGETVGGLVTSRRRNRSCHRRWREQFRDAKPLAT